MRLLPTAQVRDKRHAEEQEIRRKLVDYKAFVEKKRLESIKLSAGYEQATKDAKTNHQEFLASAEAERKQLEAEILSLERRREELNRPHQAHWEAIKKESEANLARLAVLKAELDDFSRKTTLQRELNDATTEKLMEKLDKVSDKEQVLARRELKSARLAKFQADMEEKLTKKLQDFLLKTSVKEADLLKKDRVLDVRQAILTAREQTLADNEATLARDRLHLQSQQATLRLAFQEARAKNLL